MEPVVRTLEARDEGRWRELFDAYLAFYETTIPPATVDLTWRRLSAEPVEIHGLAALVDGQLVGIAHVLEQRSTWHPVGTAYLEDLFVDPEARGIGVGTALVEASENLARSLGLAELHWITRRSNATARRLYDRLATETDFIRYELALED